jgi:hypothetical protein
MSFYSDWWNSTGSRPARAKKAPPEKPIPESSRRCNCCERIRPIKEFYLRTDTRRPMSICKDCIIEHNKKRYHESKRITSGLDSITSRFKPLKEVRQETDEKVGGYIFRAPG